MWSELTPSPPKPTTGPGDTFVVDDDPQNAPYPYQMTEQEQNRLRE
jgi:hypothetical protein